MLLLLCLLAICIEKAIFSNYDSSWLFPFFELVKKSLSFVTRFFCIEVHTEIDQNRADLTLQFAGGSTPVPPTPPVISELSLSVRNVEKAQTTPLSHITLKTRDG